MSRAARSTSDKEVFAGYLLVAQLGKGGMGEVFRAQKIGHGAEHEVALKRILDNAIESPEHLHYFLQEIQTVARLKHENIVAMYDFGQEPKSGRYYLVLALVEGYDVRTLTKRLAAAAEKTGPRYPGQERRILPMAIVAYIGMEVAKGLEFAHGQTSLADGRAVIHRDISPDNIMMNIRGVVMINDFGIAKPIGDDVDQHTRTGMLRGKAKYASPEQCCGEQLDITTDLYALAVSLYELATGGHPYDNPEHPDERIEAKVYRATEKQRAPIATLCPHMPPAMQDLLERTLQPDRSARPQSAAAFREALKLAMQQELAASEGGSRTFDYDDVKAWAARLVTSVYGKRTEVEMPGFRLDESDEPSSAPKSHKRLISHAATEPEHGEGATTKSERTVPLVTPATAPIHLRTEPLASSASNVGPPASPSSRRSGLLIALAAATLILLALLAGVVGFIAGGPQSGRVGGAEDGTAVEPSGEPDEAENEVNAPVTATERVVPPSRMVTPASAPAPQQPRPSEDAAEQPSGEELEAPPQHAPRRAARPRQRQSAPTTPPPAPRERGTPRERLPDPGDFGL